MKWIALTDLEQLDDIKTESEKHLILIFKHSTRCNISRTALDRLERNWNNGEMAQIKPYFLDLLSYREVSNKIVDLFKIEHESPQILLINKGKAILELSHFDIDYEKIKSAVIN